MPQGESIPQGFPVWLWYRLLAEHWFSWPKRHWGAFHCDGASFLQVDACKGAGKGYLMRRSIRSLRQGFLGCDPETLETFPSLCSLLAASRLLTLEKQENDFHGWYKRRFGERVASAITLRQSCTSGLTHTVDMRCASGAVRAAAMTSQPWGDPAKRARNANTTAEIETKQGSEWFPVENSSNEVKCSFRYDFECRNRSFFIPGIEMVAKPGSDWCRTRFK